MYHYAQHKMSQLLEQRSNASTYVERLGADKVIEKYGEVLSDLQKERLLILSKESKDEGKKL